MWALRDEMPDALEHASHAQREDDRNQNGEITKRIR